MNKRKEIKYSIAESIKAITDDICRDTDGDENRKRAEAIKILVDAYRRLGA